MTEESLPVRYAESLAVEVVAPSEDAARIALVDYYFPNRQRISTTEQLIELWVRSNTIKSEQTQRVYRQIGYEVVDFMSSRFNIADLRYCTLFHLHTYISWLQESKPVRGKLDTYGLSKNAVAKYVAAIKSLWEWGTRASIGYFAIDLGKDLSIRWDDKLAERILSEKQVAVLEKAAISLDAESKNNKMYWLLFTLIFYSGVRAGEISRQATDNGSKVIIPGLFWCQFREDGKYLLLTVTGKRNKTRTITLDVETSKAILEYRGDALDNQPVFPSPSRRDKGKPLSDRGLRKMMQDISELAGIKFSAHFLRHTHATVAKKYGASDFDLQSSLGHASPATTAKYIHHVGRNGTAHALRSKGKGKRQ
ncbi:integrase-recombinase protein (plasmid) [Calothrix sp. NIES-4071]|nr:integrase-recombinase protein [Calothrix sp. NIES-4071]BAZ64530.1 integrase-recombinase protein [Calothrix sp. NIES-4105]